MMSHNQEQKKQQENFNPAKSHSGWSDYGMVYSTTTSLSGTLFSAGMYAQSADAGHLWMVAAVICIFNTAAGIYGLYNNHQQDIRNHQDVMKSAPPKAPQI